MTVPETVTKIGDYAFKGMKLISEINVPDSVTSIGLGAFSGCERIETATLPFVGGEPNLKQKSDKTLFGYIFGKEKTEGSMRVEQRFDSISNSVIYYIPFDLTSVTINSGEIYYGAFYDCDMLTNVVIGEGVTAVGHNAFREALNIVRIEYNAKNASPRDSGYGAFWRTGENTGGLEFSAVYS